MCELNIRNHSDELPDADADRMKCLKRGHIIEVMPDGEYDNKPWVTCLCVPGLDVKEVIKFVECQEELVESEVVIKNEEFEATKNLLETQKINDVDVTVSMGKYVDPQLIFQGKEERIYRVKTPEIYRKKRFQIPAEVMDSLFSKGENRRVISKSEFLELTQKIIDYKFGVAVKDTHWKTEFESKIG